MRTQKETDLEDRVAKLESGNYVCPCPDGCNGCEVPDFALKEIERLQARVDADERMVRNCKCAVVLAKEYIAEKDAKIERLQAKVGELESEAEAYKQAAIRAEAELLDYTEAALEGEGK